MDERWHDAVRAPAERISPRALACRPADGSFAPVPVAAPDVQPALLRTPYEAKQSVDRPAESYPTAVDRRSPA
ncbi:hypothetical protein [Streptomyces lateritius]|uniref:hypothetical protein n=1 Tax=Streptomyces lateritius TaxID=67313 RepID=UPI0016769F16|nr:hypothetical protein [Streptomyces lateritius]